jgi:hypothetical protein
MRNTRNTFVSFEPLEHRQLFSGGTGIFSSVASQISSQATAAAQRLKAAITSQSTPEKKRDQTTPAPGNLTDTIAALRYQAELFGANKAALARAIREAGKEKPDSYDNALRLLIADGMGLPKEALLTNLKAKELIDHVADLDLVGADEKPKDVEYWQGVIKNGAEQSLAGVVANQLGIPEAAAKGKLAKELLDGAGDIALVGGDARSLTAWKGLALAKAGKISVEEFAQHYTDGKDIKSSDQQNTAGGAAQSQQFTQIKDDFGADAHQNVGSGAANQNAQPPPAQNAQPAPSNSGHDSGDTTSNEITATISNIHNIGIGSGTYNVTINYPDGTSETRTVTVNSDGSSTITHGDGTTESYPAGSTTMPPDSAEGQTGVVDQDTDGDGNGDTTTLGGDDDDKSDDDDDDNDDSSDDSKDSDNSDANSGSGGTQTPNPEAINSNIAKSANFYFNTPIGRGLAGSFIDPVKSSRGHGASDPVDAPVNYYGAAAFYARFGSGPSLTLIGGTIDYPDDHATSRYVILDKRQLQALHIISGGAVGGPDAGKKPTLPPGTNISGGVLPAPKPVAPGGTTAVFSQVRISAATATVRAASISVKINTAAVHT